MKELEQLAVRLKIADRVHLVGYRSDVPQILAAILTTATIEIALTFRQTRSFVWPASAMLTGSGVALIDYDNDGLLDAFIVSGDGAPSRLDGGTAMQTLDTIEKSLA